MDNRKPDSRKRNRKAGGRKRLLRTSLYVLLVACLATGEYFAVAAAYGNMAYRETLDLWNCGGSIEANRREPDPTYVEPVVPDVPDSLFDEFPESEDIIDMDSGNEDNGATANDTLDQA